MIATEVRAARAQTGSSLSHWLRMAARRRYLILLPMLTGALVAGLIGAATPPSYVAEAVMALDARKVQIVDIGSVVSRLPDESAALRTELDFIASRSMAELVAQRLDFSKRTDLVRAMQEPRVEGPAGWFDYLKRRVHEIAVWNRESGSRRIDEIVDAARPSWVKGREAVTRILEKAEPPADVQEAALVPTQTQIVDWLIGGLRVSNDGRSFTIYIAFADHDPAIAAEIANAFVDTYLQEMVGTKVRAAREASTWLKGRLDELRADLEAAETSVLRFSREAGLTEFRGDTIASQQISELNSQLGLIRAERARTDARIASAKAASRQGVMSGGLGDVASSPLIDSLRREIAEIDAKIADLREQGAIKHPDMLALEARRASLDRKLATEVKRAIGVLETESAALHRHEAEVADALRSMTSRYGETGEASIRLNQLKREAEASRSIYESFLNRYKETIEQAGLATPEARLLSAAEPPTRPAGSGRLPLIALGAMGGLTLGAAFASMRERFDQRLHEVADVEDLVSAPVVGVLPAVSRLGLAPDLLVSRRPHAPYSRAVRRAHAMLRLGRAAAKAKMVMVTSATAEEGKTTFCVGLARMSAGSGLRVLVVDADLHRPRIARAFGLERRSATQDVLRGATSIEQNVQTDRESGAHVLTAVAERGSGAIMSGAGWERFIEAARQTYDVVIFDTPPVTAVPDAAGVGVVADLNLLLVQWDGPTRKALEDTVRFLRLCGVRVDGAVVNRLRSPFTIRYSDPYELALRTNARLLENIGALPPYGAAAARIDANNVG